MSEDGGEGLEGDELFVLRVAAAEEVFEGESFFSEEDVEF